MRRSYNLKISGINVRASFSSQNEHEPQKVSLLSNSSLFPKFLTTCHNFAAVEAGDDKKCQGFTAQPD